MTIVRLWALRPSPLTLPIIFCTYGIRDKLSPAWDSQIYDEFSSILWETILNSKQKLDNDFLTVKLFIYSFTGFTTSKSLHRFHIADIFFFSSLDMSKRLIDI